MSQTRAPWRGERPKGDSNANMETKAFWFSNKQEEWHKQRATKTAATHTSTLPTRLKNTWNELLKGEFHQYEKVPEIEGPKYEYLSSVEKSVKARETRKEVVKSRNSKALRFLP